MRARVAFAAAIAVALIPSALAQTAPVQLAQGEAQLPTSGLVIDLPAKTGIVYHVSASWSLSGNGSAFDTRDVIDEIDTSTGNVVTGNWVLAGYFTAGGCDATLADASLDGGWTQGVTLWGEAWRARGGVFTFDSALGRRPAVMLCREKANGPALMMYHFLASQPETLSQAAVMESVSKSAALASVSQSFSTVRVKPIFPTRRAEVRNRGAEPSARSVTLVESGLEVDLPEDGYLWLPDSGDDTDFLNRLLPTFPEVTVETVFVQGVSCADMFGSIALERRESHRPLSLPAGWLDGPAMLVDGETELTMCHPVGAAALVVGVFQGPDDRDVSKLQPVLGALLAAAQKK
jgi:hypothetical protein